jgi:hypothetical protein
MKKLDFSKNTVKTLFLLAGILCTLPGIDSLAGEFKTTTTLTVDKAIGSSATWRVEASQDYSGEGSSRLPARICFKNESGTEQQCEPVEGFTVSNMEVLSFTVKADSSGILFLANTNGPDGGQDYMSLWVFDGNKKRFENILPSKLWIKAMGVYQFFPSLENKCVLVVADPETLQEPDSKSGDDDSGMWEPHCYIFSIYKYSSDKGFVSAGSFKTKDKHNPEDDNLIDSEMKNIKMLLK